MHACVQTHYTCALLYTVDYSYDIDFGLMQANNLQWECLSRLPKVYDTNLWNFIRETSDVIAAGAKVS